MEPIDDEIAQTLERLRAKGVVRDDEPESDREAEPERAIHAPERYRHCLRSTWRGAWPIAPWSGQKSEPWSVTLMGDPGRGKTHIATALHHESSRSRPRSWWMSWTDALACLREEIRNPVAPGYYSTREKLRTDGVLLLDDVGASRSDTPFPLETLIETLLYRYDHMLPTIITSNAASLGEFGGATDDRLASRLQDGIVLKLAGKDNRGIVRSINRNREDA